MSTTFERALAHTLRFEGGYVDDPDDPGGATNYGISLRWLRQSGEIERWDHDGDGDIDAADIAALSRADAGLLYRDYFWPAWLDELHAQDVAIKIFDFSVNMGPRQATRCLQRALNERADYGPIGHQRIAVDGRVGPQTLGALAVACRAEYRFATSLTTALEHHAARFYFELAERRRQSRKYLFGWLRRCYARPELPG